MMRVMTVNIVLGITMCLVLIFPINIVEATPSSGWGMAKLIETDTEGSTYGPEVSVDPYGNAVAVWQVYDSIHSNIWSNRYTVGVGWGTAELIMINNAGQAGFPQVSVDYSGNAVAVWAQSDGIHSNMWSNRYTSGVGWGNAELIETDISGNASRPQVSVTPSGNAVAVWLQRENYRNDIWSNQYTPGVGWGTAELIETDDSGSAYYPQVSVDFSGNAVAVWHQLESYRKDIWSNRYTSGVGWGTAELIETNNSGNASFPQISVDPSGNAVAVWYQSNNMFLTSIWSNRYTSGVGWGNAELIETDDSGNAWEPQVSVDFSGNAVAVWKQNVGNDYSIWSNRYIKGAGWGTAELIEPDDSLRSNRPQVSVDFSGNAIAVWEQSDGIPDFRYNIWSNRYTLGAGWGTAELIETNNAGSAFNPQISLNPSGIAFAIWYQRDGTYLPATGLMAHIWSNRYIEPDITPPILTLKNPFEGLTTELPIVTVSGTTEPGVTLNVNGILASVGVNGSFSCTIFLVNGPNNIVTTATDESGNSVSISRNVTYNDPVPLIQDAIYSMEAILTSLETSIEGINDDLDDVYIRLSLIESSLFRIETDLSSIYPILADIEIALGEYQEIMTNFRDLLEALDSEFNSSIENITDIKQTLIEIREELDLTGIGIHDLQEKMVQFEGTLISIEEDIVSIKDDQSTINESQTSIRRDIDSLEDDLDNMRKTNIVLISVLGVTIFLVLILVLYILIMTSQMRKSPIKIDGE